jgi:hypothetical protein
LSELLRFASGCVNRRTPAFSIQRARYVGESGHCLPRNRFESQPPFPAEKPLFSKGLERLRQPE